jgi:hypothetical protein
MPKLANSKKEKTKKKSLKRFSKALERLLQIKALPELELSALILIRSQIIEELMRMYIASKSEEYSHPRQVKGTFGSLRHKFTKLYPEERDFLEWLEIANETRNDIAHYNQLISLFIEDILEDRKASNRLNHRMLEKQLSAMEECVSQFFIFSYKYPLPEFGIYEGEE